MSINSTYEKKLQCMSDELCRMSDKIESPSSFPYFKF